MKRFFLLLALAAAYNAGAQPLQPDPGLMAKFSRAMLREQENPQAKAQLAAVLHTSDLKNTLRQAAANRDTFAALLHATFRINDHLQEKENDYLRALRLTEDEAAELTEYAMYLFARNTKPDFGNAPGFRYGVKRFSDIARWYYYIVTITGDNRIELKRYAAAGKTPLQKISGTLNGNLVVTGTDSLNRKYFFIEGVLGISKGGRDFEEYFESTAEGKFTEEPESVFRDYSLEKIFPDTVLVRIPYKPWFPGGKAGLAAYFEKHLQYPEEARKNKVQGRVKVSFVVTDRGKIKDVQTVGEPKGSGLEEEALRLVSAMPDWVPAKQGGRAVHARMTIPVDFILPANSYSRN